MLEIIALVYLSKKIGDIARKKGLAPGKWKFLFVIGWIFLELIGFIIAVWIFGQENWVSIILLAYMFAITSFVILESRLSKLPDAVYEDDINGMEEN